MGEISGFVNLNKPVGASSFTFVSRLRRLTGVRRIGHGGTLDPAASGVLPLCLGQATRMSDFLLTASKRYHARVRLGLTTDTYDADGRVVQERDPSAVTFERVRDAVGGFIGLIQQVPPMYSALKREGQPLYKLARAGVEVDREPRQVEVYRAEVAAWDPPFFDLDVECGRGTYIRSLAHDLGERLGCGASLQALARTRVGPFRIEEAVSIEDLAVAAQGGYWEAYLDSPDCVALHLPAAILDAPSSRAIQEGKLLEGDRPPGASTQPGEEKPLCRAYGPDGEFVALLAYDPGRNGWQPHKVFLRSTARSPSPETPDGSQANPGEDLDGGNAVEAPLSLDEE